MSLVSGVFSSPSGLRRACRFQVSGVGCQYQRIGVRGQKTDEKLHDEATFLSSVFRSLTPDTCLSCAARRAKEGNPYG